MKQRVARLGAPGNQDVEDVKQLAESPELSVGLLIEGLHPIKETEAFSKADDPSMEHVLWLIRALRYTTGGTDFCARTQHIFSNSDEEKNRKYWLNLAHGKCLSFFALWPSRDRTYIAPNDVQKNIISQWHDWYDTHGTAFIYRPLQQPPPEKWLW